MHYVTDTEIHSTIIISLRSFLICIHKGPRVKPPSLHQSASLADHHSHRCCPGHIQDKILSSSGGAGGVEARLTFAGAASEGTLESVTSVCTTCQSHICCYDCCIPYWHETFRQN